MKILSKIIFQLIGTNNVHHNTVPEIALGIYELKRQLEAKLPTANLLILGILPRKGPIESHSMEVNKIIAKFEDKKRVFFLDMSSHFQTAPGVEITDLYRSDKVHLTPKGYQVWRDVMEPTLKTVLGEH